MELKKIKYADLNARQKENYNYQKISAILADYGFSTIRLSDDWNGADFLALHLDGTTLKVQLKGRLVIAKRYIGKELWICFPSPSGCYFYPHDELLSLVLSDSDIESTESWTQVGLYSMKILSKKTLHHLAPYEIKSREYKPV